MVDTIEILDNTPSLCERARLWATIPIAKPISFTKSNQPFFVILTVNSFEILKFKNALKQKENFLYLAINIRYKVSKMRAIMVA